MIHTLILIAGLFGAAPSLAADPVPLSEATAPTPAPAPAPQPSAPKDPGPILNKQPLPPPPPPPKRPPPRRDLGLLTAEPTLIFSRWNLQDRTSGAQVALPSGISPGLNTALEQRWSPRFQSWLALSFSAASYSAPGTSETIQNGSVLEGYFGAHGRYAASPNSRWSFEGGLGFGREGMARTLSSTILEMDPVVAFQIELAAAYRLITQGASRLDLRADLLWRGPGQLSGGSTGTFLIHAGEGAGLTLRYVRALKANLALKGELFADYLSQSTDLFDQHKTAIGLRVGVFTRLF